MNPNNKKIEIVEALYDLLQIEDNIVKLEHDKVRLRELIGVDLYSALEARVESLQGEVKIYPDNSFEEVQVDEITIED